MPSSSPARSIATQLAILGGACVIAAVRPKDAHAVHDLGAESAIETFEISSALVCAMSDYIEGMSAVLNLSATATRLKAADEAWFRERGFTAVNVSIERNARIVVRELYELTALTVSGMLHVAHAAERPLFGSGERS